MYPTPQVKALMRKANAMQRGASEADAVADACIHAGNLEGFTKADSYATRMRRGAHRIIRDLIPPWVY